LVFNEKNSNINNYVGVDFPMCIYDYLKNNNLDEYLHILFTENDLYFTEENFDTFFEYEEKINDENLTIGFLRYEIKHDEKYLQ
jgi:hypothetical protein